MHLAVLLTMFTFRGVRAFVPSTMAPWREGLRVGSKPMSMKPFSSPLSILVETPEDMEILGAKLAQGTGAGDSICLSGDLGAGKTTLSRSFVRSRVGDPTLRVTSPSYLLNQQYDTDDDIEIHHYDLYRLRQDGADLGALDMQNTLLDCITLLEWPDRLGGLTPSTRLDIDIRIGAGGSSRIVHLWPYGERWVKKVAELDEAFASMKLF